jgi:hypothetical protein
MRQGPAVEATEKLHFTTLKPVEPQHSSDLSHLRLSKWKRRYPKRTSNHDDVEDQHKSFLQFMKQKRRKFLKNSKSLGFEDEEHIHKFVWVSSIVSVFFLVNLLY